MCVCICVFAPQAIKTIHVKKARITNQTSPTAFQFLCKALAIDATDGWGLSNEARHELLPNKSKVMLYLLFAVHYTVKTL